MILGELIEIIRQQSTGVSPENKLLRSEIIIELILPRVLHLLVDDIAKDDQDLQTLRQNHSLTFSSGEDDLPSNIKEEYSDSIYFVNNSGVPDSYVKTWYDFTANGSPLVATFYVGNKKIYYREAGANAGIYNGSKTINAITFPTIPSAIGDTVNIKDNLLQKLITETAKVIRGERQIGGLDYESVQ